MSKRIWFDFEFVRYWTTLSSGKKIVQMDPISVGMVDEEDRTYSATFNDFDQDEAEQQEFIVQNVFPGLHPYNERQSSDVIAQDILNFFDMQDDKVKLRYLALPHDPIILLNLFGPRVIDDVPKSFNGFPTNVKEHFNFMCRLDSRVNRTIIPKNPNAHNALADAKWLKSFELAIDRATADF